jgi:hypothetical protein
MQTTEKNFDAVVLEKFRVDENFDEPIINQVLRVAIYNELIAYETYTKVIEKFGETQPFVNIIEAEKRHYLALSHLLEKYNVPLPLNDYSNNIQIPNTRQECFELGVASEIENIAMYDNLLLYTNGYSDIQDVLFKLQAASYNNHLEAFRHAVQESYTQKEQPSLEKASEQINEFQELTSKISSGDVSQQEIMKLLSNSNISFIGGALLGAVSGAIINEMLKSKTTENSQEEIQS